MGISKAKRQKVLNEVIRAQNIATQEELLSEMNHLGISTTQASLSRDITELGILKENGFYVLHSSSLFQGNAIPILSIHQAGSNLLIVKTAAGFASTVAIGIDEAKMNGVVGTIAGDDTVFVAIHQQRKMGPIKREIVQRFQSIERINN